MMATFWWAASLQVLRGCPTRRAVSRSNSMTHSSTAQHNDVPVDTVLCLWLLALFLLGPAGRDIHSSTPTRHVWSFITGLSFLKRLNRTNTFFLVQKCGLCTHYKTRGNSGGSDYKAASLSTVLFLKLPKILYYYYFVNHKLLTNHDVGYKSIT